MEHPDQSAPPSDKAEQDVYRCKICGIQSAEVSCFAAVATEGPYRLNGTCITCNQPFKGNETWRRVATLIVLIVFPTIYLIGVRGTRQIGWEGLLIIAALIHSLLIALHEAGHAFTAKALRLEVNLVALGVGQFLWKGNVLSIPVRLYAWPLMGLTYMGSLPLRFPRTRVWLSILMGPATNLVLMAVAIILWKPLGRVVDSNVVLLWIMYNAIMVLGNLMPRRVSQFGQSFETDGMKLLRVPFKKIAELVETLALGLIANALATYKDGDYLSAKEICVRDLQCLPGNPWLSAIHSACHINLGDYESGRAAIEPLLEPDRKLPPQLRAALQNDLGVSLWLRDFNTLQLEQSLPRVDALTADAYVKYPCVLAHRSTRALILATTNRSEEALVLLEYINYKNGSKDDRANHQFARAFALRQLNRNEAAEQALAAGLKLARKRLPYLRTIGLIQ
jgi:tetratricopeptide (TPR) repeat protein